MYTQQSALEYTHNFLQTCKELNIKIDKAILFGSAVNGNMHSESDIDLALFSDRFTHNFIDNIKMISKAYIKYYELDIKTYPTSEIEEGGLLLDEILRTGVEVQ